MASTCSENCRGCDFPVLYRPEDTGPARLGGADVDFNSRAAFLQRKSEGHAGAGLHFYAQERSFHIKKSKSSFSCFLHGMDVLRTLLGGRKKDQRLRAQLTLVPTATPGGVQLSVTDVSGYLTLPGLGEYLRWCAHTPTQTHRHINKNKS